MGRPLPFQILYSESSTIFGRVVRVYGEEPHTGINAWGATRDDVACKIEKRLYEYLNEQPPCGEQECE